MFLVVLALVGGVVGSGFVTGKEIAIFFGRNGLWGYLGVAISSICFYFLFKYFLCNGDKIKKLLLSSKIFRFITIFLNIILSSSMFAGIFPVALSLGKFFALVVVISTLILSFVVFKRGGRAFNKINLTLVPIMLIAFSLIIIPKIKFQEISQSGEIFSSLWFGILYTILNVSNMALLLSSLGEKLSKKQKTQVALFSTLALGVLLIVSITVLVQNQSVIGMDMPFLSLTQGGQRLVMSFLVLIGSITTLFSLVYSSSSHLRGLKVNEMINFVFSLLLPLVISLLGFGKIVTYLYPLASVLGILEMGIVFFPKLFFNLFLKNSHKKIHSTRKDTK